MGIRLERWEKIRTKTYWKKKKNTKTDKLLTRLIKERKKIQMTVIRNERENITIDNTEIKD